jgi:UDP-N-acetylglucosamine acyltransferase
VQEALEKIEAELTPLPEVKQFLAFCRTTKRGLMGLQGLSQNDAEADHFEEQ